MWINSHNISLCPTKHKLCAQKKLTLCSTVTMSQWVQTFSNSAQGLQCCNPKYMPHSFSSHGSEGILSQISMQSFRVWTRGPMETTFDLLQLARSWVQALMNCVSSLFWLAQLGRSLFDVSLSHVVLDLVWIWRQFLCIATSVAVSSNHPAWQPRGWLKRCAKCASLC